MNVINYTKESGSTYDVGFVSKILLRTQNKTKTQTTKTHSKIALRYEYLSKEVQDVNFQLLVQLPATSNLHFTVIDRNPLEL